MQIHDIISISFPCNFCGSFLILSHCSCNMLGCISKLGLFYDQLRCCFHYGDDGTLMYIEYNPLPVISTEISANILSNPFLSMNEWNSLDSSVHTRHDG